METIKTFIRAERILLKRERELHSEPFSFALPEGARVAVIGRNGIGKSTLLHAILGEKYLSQGKIFLTEHSKSAQEMSAREISQIAAFVPQEHRYPSHFTGRRLLEFSYLSTRGLLAKGISEENVSVKKLAESLELEPLLEKSLSQMSSGERQKMFLASALVKSPEVLVLDEPTNHLDPAGACAFWKMLEAKTPKGNLILSTHDLPFVKSSCDYVLALDKKGLVFHGTVNECFEKNIPKLLFQL